MARKVSTKNGAPEGRKNRRVMDIELQDLLFGLAGLVLFLVLPVIAMMWSGEVWGVAIIASVLAILILIAWLIFRAVREPPS